MKRFKTWFKAWLQGPQVAKDANQDDLPMVDRIRANAELVVTVVAKQLGQSISYDLEGVRWLEGYLQRQHEQKDGSLHDGLVSTLGSFLGECIRRNYGGEWADWEGSWCVRFDEQNAVFPFAKVRKQLEFGAEDSVLSFYKVIPVMFKLGAG